MHVVLNTSYKSIPKGISFDVPNFCVLTGKNGSGKSHLLEAIATGSAIATSSGVQLKVIQHVGFNGLNPTVDEQCETNQVIANATNWWNQIQGISNHYREVIKQGQVFTDVVTQYLPQHGQNPVLHSVIARVLKNSGKNLGELTQEDILTHISFVDIAQNQLFFSQCALIFKAYHSRQIKNDFAEFRASKTGIQGTPFLSQSDFVQKYGPPPWDLINEILKRAGLSFEVTSPNLSDFDLPYRLRLVDQKTGVDISVNDLSSGEKVLMSLALAIYNVREGGRKPDLLLLDEPDAPLHPQFSKLLIDTIIETIIGKSGVQVMITTHSPSTVAMSPDGSVFEVDRLTKIPRLVSNAHAVQVLTEGIEYLKVSYDKRRQVFVESRYDVEYFERLHNLLARKKSFTYQPIFLEPHSGTSNCSDVIAIVDKLRSSGSDLAFGVIDFDRVNVQTTSILVLGNGSRYAIENYLLDPLFVALSLIRYGKMQFSDFGVQRLSSYIEAAQLTQPECQTIVDSILSAIGLPPIDIVPTKLENGHTIQYPRSFLLHHGHDYEQLIQKGFPELNAISKGKGDIGLKTGVMQIIEEYPGFLPNDLIETFTTLLNL